MKSITLNIFSFLVYLSLTQIQPVKAGDFEFTFEGYNAHGSGYLRFNNSALKQGVNNALVIENGQNKIKLSELANLSEINLEFDFELKDTAFFGYGTQEINFSPNGEPEFIFEFVNGLGYLVGINYSDNQPLSLSSCHYMYCADFQGDFKTTWTGNTFYNQGLGTINRYEWQPVYTWDEETGETTSDWQLVWQGSEQGNVYGEFDGLINFTTLEVVHAPEPLTLMGCGTAIGLGTLFKRHLAKKKKKD